MRYGNFDDETREYVITTPHTPYPWINYLGSQRLLLADLPHGWRLLRSTATPGCAG